ncbi:hypothetical protein J2X37_002056 [Croceicoccus sp. BE223]|nr:hypothetical protein [Croceicoccus sp. BE223]
MRCNQVEIRHDLALVLRQRKHRRFGRAMPSGRHALATVAN